MQVFESRIFRRGMMAVDTDYRSPQQMTLRILATGGTFDKQYDEISGSLVFGECHLPQAIERARITAPVVLQELFLLDSLDMLASHREQVLTACRAATETRIVIIHGTDTMAETAQVLGAAGLDKTIVLTGAMVPYAVGSSDALFNLGFACGVAGLLPAGVHVAMNGTVFGWDKVRKNRVAGRFEAG